MSNILNRFKLNLVANLYGQLVNFVYQIILVPLYLSCWSIDKYGEWLVLSSLPSYIALSNLGLMNVAQNNMTMAMGANELDKAQESLDTVWCTQIIISIFILITTSIILYFVDLSRFFCFRIISNAESKWIILLLVTYALLNLQGGIFSGIYRAIGKNARGILIGNTITLISVAVIAFVLLVGFKSVIVIAGITCGVYFLGFIFLYVDTMIIAPTLRPGIKYFNVKILTSVFSHGFSFMAYPVGRAITNQGMLLLVHSFMGSTSVVVLSTLRTVVNTAHQVSNMINLSAWPEFSRLYGAGDKDGIKRLFNFTTALGVWSGFGCTLLLFFLGPTMLLWWTKGGVIVNRTLLFSFISAIILNSTWYSATTVFNATNRHNRIALTYLMCSLIVPIVFLFMLKILNCGLASAGVGFLIMELVMLSIVLPKSVLLVGEKNIIWIINVMKFPKSVINMIKIKLGCV